MYKLLDSEWEMEGVRTFTVVTILDEAGMKSRLLESGYELTLKNIENICFNRSKKFLMSDIR